MPPNAWAELLMTGATPEGLPFGIGYLDGKGRPLRGRPNARLALGLILFRAVLFRLVLFRPVLLRPVLFRLVTPVAPTAVDAGQFVFS